MKKTTTKGKEVTYIRALVHGESGVGKTTSLATLPEDRTIIAAAERGLLPLRQKNFEVHVIEAWDDVAQLWKMFREPYRIGEVTASVLAIDSLSELGELCKKQIVTIDRKKLMKERTDDKSEKPKGIYDDQMTMEDWGLYRTRMMNMISALCHLPINIIFTCLSAWTEDKKTGELHIAPGLGGKSATECPAFFDEVFYMRSSKDDEGKSVRMWQTFNDVQVIAKDASGVLEQYEKTDWTHIFKRILNGKAGTK